MKGLSTSGAVLCAAITLTLAACDASRESEGAVDPLVAQQAFATRADPDRALAEKVKGALGLDSAPGMYGLEVTASDGAVDLWGTVDSSAARRRIVTTAAGVVGVRALRDHIQVDPGA